MMVEREVAINASVMNLFGDISTYYVTTWGINRLVEIIQEAGYGGLELHPLRLPIHQLLSGSVSEKDKNSVESLHQSFHGPRNLTELWNRLKEESPSIQARILVQHLLLWPAGNLDILIQVQKVLGRRLPVVLYPLPANDPQIPNLPFSEKLIQPNPAMMEELGVKTIDELLQIMNRRGYTGFCLDLHHFRLEGKSGATLGPWRETLPEVLEHTKEIHISAGRIDFKGEENVLIELKDLLDNTRRTDLSLMLIAVRDLGWDGLMVTEVPASAIKALVSRENPSSRILKEEDWIKFHEKIVDGVSDLLSRGR